MSFRAAGGLLAADARAMLFDEPWRGVRHHSVPQGMDHVNCNTANAAQIRLQAMASLSCFYVVRAQSLVDLTGLYRIWNPRYSTWSVFGQDHLARVLLGWDSAGASHDAVGDAIKSVRLFNLYSQLQGDPTSWQKAQARTRLPFPPCSRPPSWLQTHSIRALSP